MGYRERTCFLKKDSIITAHFGGSSACPARIKNILEKKEFDEKMRSEYEIILVFRCLSWHPSSVLLHQSL